MERCVPKGEKIKKQYQSIRLWALKWLLFLRSKILEFQQIFENERSMLFSGNKGLENKAENNVDSILHLILYAFLVSLSQEELERIQMLQGSLKTHND